VPSQLHPSLCSDVSAHVGATLPCHGLDSPGLPASPVSTHQREIVDPLVRHSRRWRPPPQLMAQSSSRVVRR
jgi:hypothetical protein